MGPAHKQDSVKAERERDSLDKHDTDMMQTQREAAAPRTTSASRPEVWAAGFWYFGRFGCFGGGWRSVLWRGLVDWDCLPKVDASGLSAFDRLTGIEKGKNDPAQIRLLRRVPDEWLGSSLDKSAKRELVKC